MKTIKFSDPVKTPMKDARLDLSTVREGNANANNAGASF